MSIHPLFIVFLVVMIGLAVWTAKKTGGQLDVLQKQGFIVTDDLNGNPRLVVDAQNQQIAIVHTKGAERLDYAQVDKVAFEFDAGVQEASNFRIEIFSNQLAYDKIAVGYENEYRAKQEFSKLKRLINK